MLPFWAYLVLVLVSSLPSLVWLAYWLRKDCHPEPKTLVTKVMLLGIMLSPLAIAGQLLFARAAGNWLGMDASAVMDSAGFYLWSALVEETVKYLVVLLIVLRSPDFDEPVDAMVYMLTAAMGFAAMENILAINRALPDGIGSALGLLGLRFAGATLLHALASALVGYFIALSWFAYSHRRGLLVTGVAFATLFHWVFNMFMSRMGGIGLMFTTALLMAMAFLISVLFDKIKERDSLVRANIC